MNENPERWTVATVHPDMWVDPDDDPREAGPPITDERSTLLDYLRRYRLTVELKCAGLDPAQLAARSVPPSTMSLLGVIRHLADVERTWWRRSMAGEQAPPLYYSSEDRDGDWDGAVADPAVVEREFSDWRAEIAFGDEFVAGVTDMGLEGHGGRQLRDILVHLIEEYARHSGHADLLRERIDGRVGQ
jgi:hypothetical protein